MLFFKNLLYLSAFAADVAPDADLLSHVEPLLRYFSGKYGDDLVAVAAA